MFPKWSDWDLQYTRKGLLKKRARQASGILLLVVVIVAAYVLWQQGSGVFFGLQNLNHLLRRYVKQTLIGAWAMVNRGITMLPD